MKWWVWMWCGRACELLVVMENGYGKRTKVDQFATHARGGVGIKAGVVTAKTGKTVDVRAIH
jgi:DNA gyrase subunit A